MHVALFHGRILLTLVTRSLRSVDHRLRLDRQRRAAKLPGVPAGQHDLLRNERKLHQRTRRENGFHGRGEQKCRSVCDVHCCERQNATAALFMACSERRYALARHFSFCGSRFFRFEWSSFGDCMVPMPSDNAIYKKKTP